MAITADNIKTRALALLGGGGDEARLAPLCAAANAQLAARLRPGVEPGDIEEQFLTAAALLALALYAELDAGTGEGSVKAGSVSVTRRGGADASASAAALRRSAEALLAGNLTDTDFAFWGVRG